jgi:hypothetical protein
MLRPAQAERGYLLYGFSNVNVREHFSPIQRYLVLEGVWLERVSKDAPVIWFGSLPRQRAAVIFKKGAQRSSRSMEVV